MCFDNLSHLPDELADAACRLATGGGLAGGSSTVTTIRQSSMRYGQWCSMPFRTSVLRGLTFSIVTLIVDFSELKPEMRRDEAQFWREFEGHEAEFSARYWTPPWWALGICRRSGSISRREWQISRFGRAPAKTL